MVVTTWEDTVAWPMYPPATAQVTGVVVSSKRNSKMSEDIL